MLSSQVTPPKQEKTTKSIRRTRRNDDNSTDDDEDDDHDKKHPKLCDNDNKEVKEECNSSISSSTYYSELQYLEAIGVLHMSQPTKHRGVATVQPDYSPTNTSDRDVRLRISYRLRHRDQSVQFALILYEHLTKNPRARRNLLAEFIAAKEEEEEDNAAPAVDQLLENQLTVATPADKNKSAGKSASIKRKVSTPSTAWKRLRF